MSSIRSLAVPAAFHDVADSASKVVASTRFMEAFEQVRPVLGGEDIATFLARSGRLDVYSVGTGKHAFRLRSQSDAASGWRSDELGVVASQLYPFVVDDAQDRDAPDLLGIAVDGKLTRSRFAPDQGRYVQEVCQPLDSQARIRQLGAAVNLRNVYVNVLLEDDTVASSFLRPDGTWASRVWVPLRESEFSDKPATAQRLTMCANDPVQKSLFALGKAGEILFARSNTRFSYFENLGSKAAVSRAIDLAVVADAGGLLHIFVIDPGGNLWEKAQKKYSSGGIQFEDWRLVANNAPLVAVKATIDAHGLLELYAVGADRRLYHTRQLASAPGKLVWASLFPLGNPMDNTVFAVGRNGLGLSEVFSVATSNTVHHFWQDPKTTQWNLSEIHTQVDGRMQTVPTHAVELRVTDHEDNPAPLTPVRLKASTMCAVRIGGLYYQLSDTSWLTVTADGGGKLTIERFTDSLATPTYLVATEFMPSGDQIALEPNASLQRRLHATSTDEVWNARGRDGAYLLSGDQRTRENAEHLARIMRESAALGMPVQSSLMSRRFLGGGPGFAMRHIPAGTPGNPFELDVSQLEDRHFTVDLSGPAPRYRALSPDDARTLRARAAATTPGNLGGFLGIDWGDIWNAIKTGVGTIAEALKDFTVSVFSAHGIVDAVKVIFRFVVDGVEYLVDKTIKLVQQIFDIIEGVWNKLKVFFEDLYRWLAFFFAWGDIKRTAEVVKHTFHETFDFLQLAVVDVRGRIEAGFDRVQAELPRAVDAFLNKIGASTSLAGYQDRHEEPQGKLDDATGHNVVLNGFTDHCQEAMRDAYALAEPGPLDQLVQKLRDLADNFQFGQGKQSFDQAMAYFESIGSHPDKVLQLTFGGVVKVMEGLAQFGLSLARGVVLTVLDLIVDVIGAVKAFLDVRWRIPFVSEIYEWITGSELSFSALDLFALVLAIPGTFLYKLVKGEAPFPDSTSVSEFEKLFTARWLAERAHIGGSGMRAAPLPEAASGLRVAFGALATVSIFVNTAVDEIDLGFKAGGKKVDALGYASTACGFASSFFSVPWLVNDDAGGLECSDPKGLSNLTWLLNVIMGNVRGAVLQKFDAPDEVDLVTISLWGGARLALTIVHTVEAGSDVESIEEAENYLDTIGGQLLRFLAVKPLVEASAGVSLVAYMIFFGLSGVVVSALHMAGACKDGEAAPRRVLLPVPRASAQLVGQL